MTQKKSPMFAVIGASSVGTMIEWYDFYIFGSLATLISTKFFPSGNETLAFLSTLATFAAGFIVRPFGALFFGRLGDLIGRKYTFMVTLLLMGGATFLIGCIPAYETIGMISPLLVLLLRLLQGLALGGEYGGAATYVAEHAPEGKRGLMTSWIQTTATAGLIISLVVISVTRASMSAEDFDAYGWRIPFLASAVMIFVSYMIRKNMHESPLFAKAKAEGKTSTNPLKESFGNRYNLKFVLLALLGVTMGQGVIWYTGQFYAMSFIERVMQVDKPQVDQILIWALCLGTPFFIFFGWLSDKIGRKWIMMAGMFLALFSYRYIYTQMYDSIDVNDRIFVRQVFEGNEVDPEYSILRIYHDGMQIREYLDLRAEHRVVGKTVYLTSEGKRALIFWVFIQVIFVTMVYGPIAAFLVEMFPVRIRYTSMSLPYHVGNGIFGGLLPAIATFLVTRASDLNKKADDMGIDLPYDRPYLEGLWYPIVIAGVCMVIGIIYLDGKDNKIEDEHA
jgi:MFS family permease